MLVVTPESLPLREGFASSSTNQHMIKCAETGSDLKPGDEVFALGRKGDPHKFPLSAEAVKKIPRKVRNRDKTEDYRSGGLNIYKARIEGENGTSELVDEDFNFSLPLAQVDLLKTASKNFNFPDREIQSMLGKLRR